MVCAILLIYAALRSYDVKAAYIQAVAYNSRHGSGSASDLMRPAGNR